MHTLYTQYTSYIHTHIHTYICVARVAHIPSLPGMYNEFIRVYMHTHTICTNNDVLVEETKTQNPRKYLIFSKTFEKTGSQDKTTTCPYTVVDKLNNLNYH